MSAPAVTGAKEESREPATIEEAQAQLARARAELAGPAPEKGPGAAGSVPVPVTTESAPAGGTPAAGEPAAAPVRQRLHRTELDATRGRRDLPPRRRDRRALHRRAQDREGERGEGGRLRLPADVTPTRHPAPAARPSVEVLDLPEPVLAHELHGPGAVGHRRALAGLLDRRRGERLLQRRDDLLDLLLLVPLPGGLELRRRRAPPCARRARSASRRRSACARRRARSPGRRGAACPGRRGRWSTRRPASLPSSSTRCSSCPLGLVTVAVTTGAAVGPLERAADLAHALGVVLHHAAEGLERDARGVPRPTASGTPRRRGLPRERARRRAGRTAGRRRPGAARRAAAGARRQDQRGNRRAHRAHPSTTPGSSVVARRGRAGAATCPRRALRGAPFRVIGKSDERLSCGVGDIELLPILPLRNSVVFPASVVPINVGRPRSVRLVEDLARATSAPSSASSASATPRSTSRASRTSTRSARSRAS